MILIDERFNLKASIGTVIFTVYYKILKKLKFTDSNSSFGEYNELRSEELNANSGPGTTSLRNFGQAFLVSVSPV